MKTKIIISDIRIYAYHGVLPAENLVGTYYRVSIEAEVDFQKATETDDLNDTISYADINDIVHTEMAISSQLIEHVAGRIYNAIKQKFPAITALKVSVTKENPPMKGECAGATVVVED